jgi:hypothetical protein
MHSRSYTEDGGGTVPRSDYVKSSPEDGGIRYLETFTIETNLKMEVVMFLRNTSIFLPV